MECHVIEKINKLYTKFKLKVIEVVLKHMGPKYLKICWFIWR